MYEGWSVVSALQREQSGELDVAWDQFCLAGWTVEEMKARAVLHHLHPEIHKVVEGDGSFKLAVTMRCRVMIDGVAVFEVINGIGRWLTSIPPPTSSA